MILTSAAGRTKVTNVYLCTTSSRSLGGTFQTSDWCASVPQCISTQLRASGVLWFQASFRLLKHLGRKKLPTHKLKTPKNCMEKPVFAVDDWKLFESKDIYSGRDVKRCGEHWFTPQNLWCLSFCKIFWHLRHLNQFPESKLRVTVKLGNVSRCICRVL